MKKFSRYYLVDTLTESIIGSFNAISSDMARKIVEETYNSNEKLNIGKESHRLMRSLIIDEAPETYDEVMSVCVDAKWQPVTLDGEVIE